MKFGIQIGSVLVMGCVLAGGRALAVQAQDAGTTVRPSRFKFSETMRKEIMTKEDFNSKETQSAQGGQVTLEFDLPLTSGEGGDFGPSTPVVVKAGTLEFRSTLDKDPNFRAGDNSATIKVTLPTNSNKSRIILATASLHWDKKKLSVKLDSKTPDGVRSVAAEDFLGNERGDIVGETKVKLQFGSIQADATVPFRGKLDHLVRETIGLRGEVITVNLRGELKKP